MWRDTIALDHRRGLLKPVQRFCKDNLVARRNKSSSFHKIQLVVCGQVTPKWASSLNKPWYLANHLLGLGGSSCAPESSGPDVQTVYLWKQRHDRNSKNSIQLGVPCGPKKHVINRDPKSIESLFGLSPHCWPRIHWPHYECLISSSTPLAAAIKPY